MSHVKRVCISFTCRPSQDEPISCLVSIITPARNAALFLDCAIRSVVEQSIQDWELILVDDGSTDKTREIMMLWSAKDARIKCIMHTEAQGAAAARNTAIDASSGSYYAFLDADDLWHSEKLAQQLQFMQDKNVDFCCTDFAITNASAVPIGYRPCQPRVTHKELLRGNTIGTSTVIITRNCLGDLRFPYLMRRQDFGLWLQVLSAYDVCYGLNVSLTQYRRHANSLSSSKFKSALATWRVYKTVPNLSRTQAVWSYLNYLMRTGFKHLRTYY